MSMTNQLSYRTQGLENVKPFLKEKTCFPRYNFCQYLEIKYLKIPKYFLNDEN